MMLASTGAARWLAWGMLAGVGELDVYKRQDVYRSQDRLTILAIADVKRHEYLPDVPTLQELGYNVDDASVNFRGYALPKGVDPSIVDKAAKIVPVMFHDPEVVKRMKDSGSPMLIMDRAQVLEMFQKKQETLKALISDLRK